MRIYVFTPTGALKEVRECEDFFRKDGSFLSREREVFKRAIQENDTIIFAPHNKNLVTNISLKIENFSEKPSWHKDIDEFLKEGKRIEAIKLYKEKTGVLLREAYTAVKKFKNY